MSTLINILITFFFLLIIYQLILANSIIEGLQGNDSYQPYDTNNPSNVMILAQQNAGNIQYIMDRLDSIQNTNEEVNDLKKTIVTLQDQVNGIVSAQEQYASQMTGGTAPDITGIAEDTTNDISN
jgi:hypothetical protein